VNLQRARTNLITILLTAVVLIGAARGSGPDEKWQSPLGRDHPLAGRIWDVAAGRFIDSTTLVVRLARGRFVLLGEKHDNPDHHRLQAWLLSALVTAGRRPAVGFEMFGTDQQPAIDRHLAAAPTDAAGLAGAVNWDRTGWPDWALYQPIAEVALEAGLPLIATNLPRTMARSLRRRGLAGVEAKLVTRLGLERPLAPAIEEAMAAEIRESHCGYASDTTVEAMITVQRARDAQMAERLAAASQQDGAVLIAGLEHARTDWGVPKYLATRLPGTTVTSLAFLEVDTADTDPAAYATRFGRDTLPFEYAWFTPRLDDSDPCEKFNKQLKGLREKN
jgi:uncharacterized iron-regulated protein